MRDFVLSRSSRKILAVLSNSQYTQKQIHEKTGLALRTISIRFTIDILKKEGLVLERRYLFDMIKKFYVKRGDRNE